MRAMASQITSLTSVYSTVYSGADERKHQSSASLAYMRGIHRWSVNSPHKGPITRNLIINLMTSSCNHSSYVPCPLTSYYYLFDIHSGNTIVTKSYLYTCHSNSLFKHIKEKTEMADILQATFWMHFLEIILSHFDEVCHQGHYWN